MSDKTFELSNPITLPSGDILSFVNLREPTVADVVKNGYPVTMGYDGSHVIIIQQPKAVLGYLSDLSGNPPSTFKNLSIKDFAMLSQAVQGFFPQESPETNSS